MLDSRSYTSLASLLQVHTLSHPSCSLSAVACSPARRDCGTEQEGRILLYSRLMTVPYGGYLSLAALLRSVPHPCDVLSNSGHEHEQEEGRSNVYADEQHDQKQAGLSHVQSKSRMLITKGL